MSADIYWFTDPNVSGGYEGGNYGYTVDRLRALDAMDRQRRPIWSLVEVGWPASETAAQGARAIQPAEVKACGVAQHYRRGAGHHLFQPQFRWSEPDTALPARTGIPSGARCGKEHEPTHHATCASPQRTIRGQLSYGRPISPDYGEVPRQQILRVCWRQGECRKHVDVLIGGC